MARQYFAPYITAAEMWDAYEERFECYLEANKFTNISSGRKRAHFLNTCGPEVFATARTLVAPQPVHTMSWEVLKGKLWSHYSPTPSQITRWFKLRLQNEGESINQYVAHLRMATVDCEYMALDDALVEH